MEYEWTITWCVFFYCSFREQNLHLCVFMVERGGKAAGINNLRAVETPKVEAEHSGILTADHICCWGWDITLVIRWSTFRKGTDLVTFHSWQKKCTDLLGGHICYFLYCFSFSWEIPPIWGTNRGIYVYFFFFTKTGLYWEGLLSGQPLQREIASRS